MRPSKAEAAAGIVTKAAFARELSISRERVGAYGKRGMPTLPDGRIERAAAIAWVAAHVNLTSSQSRAQIPADISRELVAGGGGPTFPEVRRMNEILKARRAQLEIDRMRGKLVERTKAHEVLSTFVRTTRDALLAWPAAVAADLASDLGLADLAPLEVALTNRLRAQLEAMATVPPPDDLLPATT